MFKDLIGLVRRKADQAIRLCHEAWSWLKGTKWFEAAVIVAVFLLRRRIPSRIAMALISRIFPRVREDRRWAKQANILLGIVWTLIAVLLWHWAREVALVLVWVQVIELMRLAWGAYRRHRGGWRPGSAVLLALWDAFGEFGESLVSPIHGWIHRKGEESAPEEPFITRRFWAAIRRRLPVDPLVRLWRRWGRRVVRRAYPSSSKDPRRYDLPPFEGRARTRYWVEEHRNPTKSFAGEQSVELTPEQARELRRAVKGANGRLYRKGTETMDPSGAYAVDGEVVGTWHNDITVQHPNGDFLRWATVPPKDPDAYDQPGVKPGMGRLDIFPGYAPDEEGGTKVVTTTWVLQPEHLSPTNPETIGSGYGKGVCKVVREGRCDVWLGHEHSRADGSKIRYLHFDPEGIDGKYAVIHEPGNDKHIVVRLRPRPIPRGGKVRMDEARPGTSEAEELFSDPDWIAQAKKDGASGWIRVDSDEHGSRISMGSWREDKRLYDEYGVREPIDHTDKLAHIRDVAEEIPPGSLDFEGRIEVWCGGENGDRNLQQKLQWDDIKASSHQARPYIYLVDVTRWNGEDVTHLPYEERLRLIQEIHRANKVFKVPPTAWSEQAKRNLWDKGRDEAWVDGVVFKHRTDPDRKPVKLKYRWEDSRKAVIIGVNEGHGKMAGTTGSFRCRDLETGTEFSVSGEGMTDEVRAWAWEHREEVDGREVEYHCCPDRMRIHGEVFQPTLAGFEGGEVELGPDMTP